MSNEHEYSCLFCGESSAKVSIRQIYNKELELTVECNNCLSKLFVDGKYIFIPFANQNIASDEQKGM